MQVFYLNRAGRRRFIKKVITALKTLGYCRGIVFIHFFGDDPTKYAFHLHILVDGEWLDPEPLDELCRKIRRMIYPRWVLRKWGDKLAVNYHYKPTQGQVYQALEYNSRPTFTLFDGNEWLDASIAGERKVRRWGKWDEEPKWHLDESEKKVHNLVALQKGKCPVCGEPIKWDKGVTPFAQVQAEVDTELAPGYLLLSTERAPPKGRLDLSNLIELPDGDYRKHSNACRKEIDRHRELISRRHDYDEAS
ncbi:unnamed protein product [marine sediment metagenome]|uniref:Uncharacterized protein n=2 Tax=marine sediment metagenome TaxID=412755 RepID=X1PVD8_9ZZZZ